MIMPFSALDTASHGAPSAERWSIRSGPGFFPVSVLVPRRSKVPDCRAFKVSILGIVNLVLGRYLIV